MTLSLPSRNQGNWDVPLNAALTALDTGKQDKSTLDADVASKIAAGPSTMAALAAAVNNVVTAAVVNTGVFTSVDRKNRDARALSGAQVGIDYATAVETTEDWTNLTNVTAPANAQVSGGKFFAVSGTAPGGWNKTKNLSALTTWKLQCLLYYKAGGTGNFAFIGINCGAAGQSVLQSDGNSILVGFYNTNQRLMSVGTNLTAINVYGAASLNSDPTVDSTYLITIEADSEDISFTMKNINVADDVSVWSFERSALTSLGKTINNLACYLTDSRGLSGHSFSPWILTEGSLQNSRTTTLKSQLIQGSAETYRRRSTGVISATNAQVYVLPKSYDARKPCPLVMWAHQSVSGSAWDYIEEARVQPVTAALLNAGFIIAGVNDQESGGNWGMGNSRSEAEYLDLYSFLIANYNIGPLFWYGASMGGLDIANAVGRNVFPSPAACAVVGGAFDLGYVWDLGGAFRTYVEAAYSASGRADLLTKSAAYDPIRRAAYTNKNIPWRLYTSNGDTTQPPAQVEAFKSLISPYAAEAVTVYGSGNHLDPSQYQASDVLAFFNKYR